MHSGRLTSESRTGAKKGICLQPQQKQWSHHYRFPLLSTLRMLGNQDANQFVQAKLKIGRPNDKYEQEADRVADQIISMPDAGGFNISPGDTNLQRKCAPCAAGNGLCPECEEENNERLQRKPISGAITPLIQRQTTGSEDDKEEEFLQKKPVSSPTPGLTPRIHEKINALNSSGQPLSTTLRSFFEPRLGQDFSGVRIHTGDGAANLANGINARAFTLGRDIVFGHGQYQPGGSEGRRLLAHELTHVVQQSSNQSSPPEIQRQVIGTGCGGREDILRNAWAEGQRLTERTIETLESVRTSIGYGEVHPSRATAIQNAFGHVGLTPGDITFVPELIRRYNRILGGFTGGKTLRCDPESVPSDRNECDWRSAFVVVGDNTNIFLCPGFFEADVSVTSRGLTLLHEMAHSVLRIGHDGIAERTYPDAFFDCRMPLGIEFDDAKRNAFAFELLANCLHGERPSSEVRATRTATPEGGGDAPWSISASAGADITPDAYRFASALSGRVSLRTGEHVVFNPVIGLNILYLPRSSANPSHLVAATADLGLRIQQPLTGFYFDISAGGFAGFDIDPDRAPVTEELYGFTPAAGAGWRWRSLELGAELRALIPHTGIDDTDVIIFGRTALRFP